MKMGWARGLVLAVAALSACSKGTTGETTDAGPHGPTNLSVKWAFTGQAASASVCTAHGATDVFVTLSATLDPTLHKTVTAACDKGTVSLGSPLVENLGMPFVEAALLDDKGVTVATASATVTPTVGTTTVTLDFYPATGTGGAGGMGSSSSSTSSSTTAASSSGAGGAGGAASSSSGAGGSASSTSGAGGADAG